MVYRLGKRLPIKGPGLVLTLPFIDSAHVIDLNEQVIEMAVKDNRTGEPLNLLTSMCNFLSSC